VTSGKTNVTFNEPARPISNFRNLDLVPLEDIDSIMIQRKTRFDSLLKMQQIMEKTKDEDTPGKAFLDKAMERNEKEKADRIAAESKR